MEYYYEPAIVTCAMGLFTDFPALLASTSVATIAYALHLAVGVAALLFLLNQGRRKSPNSPRHLIFIMTLLLLGTINISMYLFSVTICHRRSVQNENFQRQREARCSEIIDLARANGWDEIDCYEASNAPIVMTASFDLTRGQDATGLLIGVLAQGYLLFRCHLLLGRRLVTGTMGFLYFAIIAFGITNIIYLPSGEWKTASSTPALGPRMLHTRLTYIYFALSITFNVSANVLIVSRLFLLRARLRTALGNDHGRMYAGVAAMLLESSALYSTVLVVAFAALPGDGGAESLFHPLVAQSEALAAELIILRFALGRSLSREDVVSVTTLPKLRAAPRARAASSDSDLEDTGPREDVALDTREIGRLERMPQAKTTFSEFPSSVAAVLNSQRSNDFTATR